MLNKEKQKFNILYIKNINLVPEIGMIEKSQKWLETLISLRLSAQHKLYIQFYQSLFSAI